MPRHCRPAPCRRPPAGPRTAARCRRRRAPRRRPPARPPHGSPRPARHSSPASQSSGNSSIGGRLKPTLALSWMMMSRIELGVPLPAQSKRAERRRMVTLLMRRRRPVATAEIGDRGLEAGAVRLGDQARWRHRARAGELGMRPAVQLLGERQPVGMLRQRHAGPISGPTVRTRAQAHQRWYRTSCTCLHGPRTVAGKHHQGRGLGTQDGRAQAHRRYMAELQQRGPFLGAEPAFRAHQKRGIGPAVKSAQAAADRRARRRRSTLGAAVTASSRSPSGKSSGTLSRSHCSTASTIRCRSRSGLMPSTTPCRQRTGCSRATPSSTAFSSR